MLNDQTAFSAQLSRQSLFSETHREPAGCMISNYKAMEKNLSTKAIIPQLSHNF